MSSNPKVEIGIVKQVNSGDNITVRGQPRGERPKERTLIFSSIAAPKLAKRPVNSSEESKDEPYAWEAREFLRKKIIGQSVSFVVEKSASASGASGRDYATVYLNKDTPNEENLTETLIKEGYATVRVANPHLKELEEQAKNAGKGKHAKSPPEEHIREIVWNVPVETLTSLYEKLKSKTTNAIVEHVRDGSTLRVFIVEDNVYYNITLMIAGIKAPSYKIENGKRTGDSDPVADEAQFFVEKNLLQRDVEVTLVGVNNNNLIGSVILPSKGSIAEGLLLEGFAKCVDWTMRLVKNPEVLRAAEKKAKEKKLKVWKNIQPPVNQLQLSSSEKEFQATVIEVLNGDGLIVKPANGVPKKIFLASIRPPRPPTGEEKIEVPRGKGSRPLYDIPWMFDAREFLRKKLIGKKVNVVIDYIQAPREGLPEKVCCTVTITGGINVAEAMVSKGLATVVKYRADDDQRSSAYDSLMAAEAKAIKNQKGLHSKKDTPVQRINDYSSDSSKAKNIFPHIHRTSGRTEALVEFVASGSRLRLYIPKESCLITLLLAGISCPRAPRQNQNGTVPIEGQAYGEEALTFTKERCLQREVEIALESVDKAGNFIGWLWIENVNLSVALVQEGLSEVHFSAERSNYYRQLLDAENSAKAKKLNMWKNYTEEEDKEKKQKEDEEANTERKVNHQKVVVIEVTNELHIFTQLEDQIPKLDALRAKLNSELAGVTPGTYTPKRGELCAAKFQMDSQWYRAKVEKVTGNMVKVFYVDYGNSDEVNVSMCAALPAGLESDKYYATEYAIGFVKLPKDSDDQEIAIGELRHELLNRSVLLNVEYRGVVPYVTLYSPENDDIVKILVEEGFLMVDVRKDRRLKSVVESYLTAQKKAMKEHLQIWQHGDITEDDDKEFGLGRR